MTRVLSDIGAKSAVNRCVIDELEVLVSSSTWSLVLYQAMIAGGLALTLHMTMKVVSPPLMLMSPTISISLAGTIEHEKEGLNVNNTSIIWCCLCYMYLPSTFSAASA